MTSVFLFTDGTDDAISLIVYFLGRYLIFLFLLASVFLWLYFPFFWFYSSFGLYFLFWISVWK